MSSFPSETLKKKQLPLTVDDAEYFCTGTDFHDEHDGRQTVDGYVAETHGGRRPQTTVHGLLQSGPVALESDIPAPQHEIVLEHLHDALETQQLGAEDVRQHAGVVV